jgi:pilus assembly protein CpaB
VTRSTGPAPAGPLSGLRPRTLHRAAARHRVLLAAGLAAAAVALGLTAVSPEPEPGVPVLTAVRDLAPGSPLTPADVVPVAVPRSIAPAGALTAVEQATGRLVTGPVRKGEPITDVRLLGTGLLEAGRQPGGSADGRGADEQGADERGADEQGAGEQEVAVPVRVADAGSGAVVRPGDRVDVLAASADSGPVAAVVAGGARVLSVPGGVETAEGALLVLATTRSTAARLAAAAVTSRLSLVVLPR